MLRWGKKIKKITRRLEETFGHKVDLRLEKLKLEIENAKASSQTPIPSPPPPPLAHESTVCGRVEDKSKILAMLTHDERCDAPIPRVPLTTRQLAENLWISGAPTSHSHVSYIETHSCIFNSQYTKIYDGL